MKKLVLAGVTALAITAAFAGTASASGWHSCPAPTRSGGSYEYDWKASSLQASGSMNCSSARYAFAFLTGKAQSRGWYALRAANDGYVTWHRTRLTSLSGPDGGCGTWVSNLTYSEFSSGTAMRFRLVESGC